MAVQYHNNYVDTTNFSDVTPRMALRAGPSLSYTVPGNATQDLQALFEYGDDCTVFVGYNVDVTVAAQDTVTTGRFVEIMPKKRFVKGGDVLYFATPDPIAYIGISFRAIP